MRFPFRRLALSLMLCVSACSTSSTSPPLPSQALQAATARVEAQLDHPAPPAALTLCQSGDKAVLTTGSTGAPIWWCPPPRDLVQSMTREQLQDQLTTAIGDLQKETDRWGQLLDWAYGKGSAAASQKP